MFVEKAGDHVVEELELVIVWRLEVKHEADTALSEDATQSSTVTRQPVETSLVQRHGLRQPDLDLSQDVLRHYDL